MGNHTLKILEAKLQTAEQMEQIARESYQDAIKRTNELNDMMAIAWNERRLAAERKNRESQKKRKNDTRCQNLWAEYDRIRDANNARIEKLKTAATQEHQAAQRDRKRARDARRHDNDVVAKTYSDEAYEHQLRRDQLNAEITALGNQVRKAKQRTKCDVAKFDAFAFNLASDDFERAKDRHATIQAEYQLAKKERNQLKAEYLSWQTERIRLAENLTQLS